ANLLFARGVSRQGEMAIRLSLGAGRRRLLGQLLAESLLLAIAGGALGVLAAYWILPLLAALNPIQAVSMRAILGDFRIDARALLASLAVTLSAGVASGILPAWRATRSRDLSARMGPRQPAGGAPSQRRPLAALVIGEIAMSAALLFGGSLMLQSFQRLHKTDLGFRPDHLLTMPL